MAKAECDRTMTIKLPSQTNAANGRTRSTRASQRFGTLQLSEGPGIFQAGSFARPIYRKEETERVEANLLKAAVVHLTAAVGDAPANRAIIMTNAWQDPEVPARSATIKPTQALWQNFSR